MTPKNLKTNTNVLLCILNNKSVTEMLCKTAGTFKPIRTHDKVKYTKKFRFEDCGFSTFNST